MTLIETLDRLPPCLVRLVARDPRHNGRRLTLKRLSDISGLSYGATQRLSGKRTWSNVTPAMIEAFCSACGVDILRPQRKIKYLLRVLKKPNGYKLLATKSGRGSVRSVLKVLQSLES